MSGGQSGTISWPLLIAIESIGLLCLFVGLYALRRLKREPKSGLPRSHMQAKSVDAARMPLDFLKPEPRKLEEVALGEEVWIHFTDVEVYLNGATYVNLDARVQEHSFGAVGVRLEREGAVLTLFLDDDRKFTPRKPYESLRNRHLPVIEIRQEASRRDIVASDGP